MVKLDDLLRERRLTSTLTQHILFDTDASHQLEQAKADYDAAVRAHDRAVTRVKQAGDEDGNRLLRPRVAVAEEALAKASADLEEASAAYEQAQADAEPHLVDFVFESVGSDLWQRLHEMNPSPEAQRERLGDADPGYHARRFPIVAVAFSLQDPAVPDEELEAYLDEELDNDAERPLPPTVAALQSRVPDIVWDQIVGGAMVVNRGPNRVPKSLTGSGKTPTSEPRSEQP